MTPQWIRVKTCHVDDTFSGGTGFRPQDSNVLSIEKAVHCLAPFTNETPVSRSQERKVSVRRLHNRAERRLGCALETLREWRRQRPGKPRQTCIEWVSLDVQKRHSQQLARWPTPDE
jgi:hypothetical protein